MQVHAHAHREKNTTDEEWKISLLMTLDSLALYWVLFSEQLGQAAVPALAYLRIPPFRLEISGREVQDG